MSQAYFYWIRTKLLALEININIIHVYKTWLSLGHEKKNEWHHNGELYNCTFNLTKNIYCLNLNC